MRHFLVASTAVDLPRVPEGRAPIPEGMRLRADRTLEWIADELIAGGSPWRLVRLTAQGSSAVSRWLDGEPVSADPSHGALARRLVDAGMLHPIVVRRRVAPGEVDVVVPVRDDLEGLDAVLRAMAHVPVRVVVVDDGSADAAGVARVAAAHEATLHRLEVPLGPGGARNEGLARTTAPLVCFLDADVRPPADLLDRLVGHFVDPLVAVAAPRVRGPNGPTVKERFESVASPLDLGPHVASARHGGVVPYVPSAAIVVRRSALGGGFDASLRVGEDVDLCWRLHEAGWLVRHDPTVVVTHAARETWREWVHQRVRYGTSAAPLEARHGDAAAPLRADPRILLTLSLALAGRPRAALGVLSVAGASLSRQLEGIAVRGGSEQAARQLALRGTVLAAPGLARSAFRSYGPLLLAGAVAIPPLRRPVALLAVGATATRWWRAGRPKDRASFAAMSVADDLCYGVGLLVGAARTRRVGALRPRLRGAAALPAPVSRT